MLLIVSYKGLFHSLIVWVQYSGRRPFKATERDLLLEQQAKTSFPAPRNINLAISPLLEHVLVQALAYKPEERFPTIQAFADAYMKALLGVAVVPKPKLPPIAASQNQ